MSEDIAGSSFLGTSTNFFLPESRTMSFAVDEEDPWSAAGFDPVNDMRQPLTQSQTMDEQLVTEGITAANVLVGVDLPEVFDTAYIRAGPVGDRVSVEALEVIIGLGGLGPRVFEQIAALIVPSNAMYVTRNEFNTGLALLGFAQKNMELSLLKVYQHRNDLPIPLLSNLNNVSIKRSNPLMASNTKSKRRQSFDDDPWRIASTPPAANNGFPYQVNDSIDVAIAGRNTNDPTVLTSTGLDTSNQTSDNDTTTASAAKTTVPKRFVPVDVITDKASTQALVKASTESYQWFLDLDQITVTVAEKEGFLFTHINYWVHSNQRQTSVRRRYSDFYWFWETLLKRYPFRVIPNLPPKKISGKDKAFLEKRCQGLSRFINCIVRHPVLKNDEEVITFLTEQTEFLAWRRAKLPNLEEEFVRVNPQTEELETFIPKDLDSRIEQIKSSLPSSIEKYDTLCSVMEKTIRLKEARAIEMRLYNDTLKELRDVEHQCFVPNCQACGQVVRGYENVGTYLSNDSSIIEAETASAITGVLENLKRHRDISGSFLEMLDRKSKLDANQISALYKKIAANTARVNQNRGVPGLESEVERLDTTIKADTEKMIYQQRRDTYIRYCLASELSYLHKQQAFVSLLYQNYVHEQLQYARRTVDNWKALEALLCELPKPEDFS
ncbi:60S ribosomal protein L34B [Mucor velutinosus]|uniref:Sorting nexin MVP1 n=1 Tax=Mucor velutinosus TaxID=708070 RepID=A0AAN7HW58_9FUNG|nr:60S ribosomal protein L34B [Mucor velutinosus]